ncbi:hypothetical protein [Polyangium mundeleinium]|uniref:Lipoprotein n=1 Tax=Polyangium mundeleinium TaxID=2995306 RepID=A0ABT5EN08_9BACT|nr:hypothetical protein [Polyangium mundeleinium]MDC0743218.1 hypothetical protein [Polyangium mundeleinium]
MNRNWMNVLALALGVGLTACVAETEPGEGDELDMAAENEELAEASEALCTPYVSYVTPISAKLNQKTTFYVVGSCLPATTAFWVDQCAGVTMISYSSSQVAFQCTPSWSTGYKAGVVKGQTGGVALKNFTVSVY